MVFSYKSRHIPEHYGTELVNMVDYAFVTDMFSSVLNDPKQLQSHDDIIRNKTGSAQLAVQSMSRYDGSPRLMSRYFVSNSNQEQTRGNVIHLQLLQKKLLQKGQSHSILGQKYKMGFHDSFSPIF